MHEDRGHWLMTLLTSVMLQYCLSVFVFFSFMIANENCAAVTSDCEVLLQAATSENKVIIDQNTLPEILLCNFFHTNYNFCETYDLINKQAFITNANAHLIIHV